MTPRRKMTLMAFLAVVGSCVAILALFALPGIVGDVDWPNWARVELVAFAVAMLTFVTGMLTMRILYMLE